MPETLDFILYDTAPLGTTANVEHNLFQNPQGSTATHTEDYTNMIGAGTLPEKLKFTIKKISVSLETGAASVDIRTAYLKSFLELIIGGRSYIKAPLIKFADAEGLRGHFAQATAATENMMSMIGEGFKLELPQTIEGGTPFRVRLFQVTAMGTARQMKVMLTGILERE